MTRSDADASEFDHSAEGGAELVIARCDASEVFEFVEVALRVIKVLVELRQAADRWWT